MLDQLRKYHILLASKSPRRRELLAMLRLPFNILNIGGIDESYPETMVTDMVPVFLSEKKAAAYLPHTGDDALIITADTLVILDNEIMGKPKNSDNAVEMLLRLSERTHRIVTGVSIATHEKQTSFSATTYVTFGKISEEQARYYVENYLPLDKAGAYGIQEWIGGVAVEKIDGSFYNVMGLPVHQLYKELSVF